METEQNDQLYTDIQCFNNFTEEQVQKIVDLTTEAIINKNVCSSSPLLTTVPLLHHRIALRIAGQLVGHDIGICCEREARTGMVPLLPLCCPGLTPHLVHALGYDAVATCDVLHPLPACREVRHPRIFLGAEGRDKVELQRPETLQRSRKLRYSQILLSVLFHVVIFSLRSDLLIEL